MPNKRSNHINYLIQNLPIIVPIFTASFGTAMMALLVAGKFYTLPVVLLAGLFALGTVWLTHKKLNNSFLPGSDREKVLGSLTVLIFVLLWIGFNAKFTAQHVFTNRDPGVYTVTGIWLTQKNDLIIEKEEVFGQVEGIGYNSGGFMPNPDNPDEIHAQGVHLLPSIAGLSGRLFGLQFMFRINVLLGGIALLAIYAFARTILRPKWALLAPIITGLSLPMMYFSRDMYTEPLLAAFTFGMLALITMAIKTSDKFLWFVAGLLCGACALTRIDGYLTIAMTLAFIVTYASLNTGKVKPVANSLTFVVGASVPAIIGWVDLTKLSRSYFLSEWPNIKLELILIAMILVAGFILFFINHKTNIVKRLDVITKKWSGWAIFIVVLLTFGLLASRPLWYVSYAEPVASAGNSGAATTLVRDYYERSFIWLAWYIGPVMTAFGALGLAYFSGLTAQKRNLFLLAPLLVIVGTSVFYINDPNIHPDHIWAARRFLPVVFPGFIIFGLAMLKRIYNTYKTKNESQKKILRFGTVGLVLLGLFGPVWSSGKLSFVREATWYQAVEATCSVVNSKSAILWVGSARTQLIEATKSVCETPAAGYGALFSNNQMPPRHVLAAASTKARMQGYRPLIGLFGSEKSLLESKTQVSKVVEYSYQQIEKTIGFPRVKQAYSNTILIGEIQNDGTITPLLL